MLTLNEAKTIVHGPRIETRESLLVLLAIEPIGATPISELKDRCLKVGLRRLVQKNLSDILGKSKGLVARTEVGWELQATGINRVTELASQANINLVVTHSSRSLRSHAETVSDGLTKSFVLEAIHCFESKQYRAAVVFSWAGAIALMHNHVFSTKLDSFNIEAQRRDAKWRLAKQQDDLGRMSENEFLNVCETIGVIGKNVKQLLQNECLLLRNTCGHPNSASIDENSVAAHIEKLIKNVFCRF